VQTMSENSSGGIGCIGAVVIIVIILLIFGLISLNDVGFVITRGWEIFTDACGAICIGTGLIALVIGILIIMNWISKRMD